MICIFEESCTQGRRNVKSKGQGGGGSFQKGTLIPVISVSFWVGPFVFGCWQSSDMFSVSA